MNSPGDEFRIKAAPTQEQLRRLLYLATQDSDSVQTGGFTSPRNIGAHGEKRGRDDRFLDLAQLVSAEQQARQQRIAALNDRLDDLDRASREALRQAEERLAAIRRNANRTRDGRLAFEAEDGTIRDEHGNEVREEEIDRTTWNESADTWEDFRAAQSDFDAATELQGDVIDARNALESDPDDEDLDALELRIGQLEVAAGLRAAEPAQEHALDEGQGGPRSTSAAKLYEGDPLDAAAAPLNAPFAGATNPLPPQETPERPATIPRPDVPFRPD